jgi:UDPglucose 6-dehydrogenase
LGICTEWKNFRVVDFDFLASKLRARVIIDGRNLYNPEHLAAAGLLYRGIGLRHTMPSVLGPQA